MSVFMKSTHGYDIVTIESGVMFGDPDEFIEFGRFLGLTVTEVLLDHFEVENDLNPYLEDMCSFLKAINEFSCQRAQITINRVYLDEIAGVENILSVLKFAKVNRLDIVNEERSNEEMKMLSDAEILDCEHLEFLSYFEHSPWPFLKDFQHQNVKTISISSRHLPPPSIAFPRITELYLDLQGNAKSLKPLESLINLRTLQIHSETAGCGIIHQPVTLMNLQTLEINGTHWTCPECLETMFCSFKTLKELYINTGHQFTLNRLISLIKNWKSITKIEIRVDTFEFHIQDGEEFDISIECIHSLLIEERCTDFSITTEAIKHLSKAFPNVTELFLSSHFGSLQFIPSFEKIVQTVIQAFTNLDYLELWSEEELNNQNSPTIDKSQLEVVVTHLAKHGYQVEVS